MTDVRRKILDASVALVEEQGVRAVSFREVARRAGVSHQTPYHHFGNHRGILRAIAAEGFGKLCQDMQAAADQAGPDPLDSLSACGVAYAKFAKENVGHFRVMFQKALVDLRDDQAPIEEAAETHGTLLQLAQAAHDAGYGSGLDVEALANLCWSTVHGIAVLLVEGVITEKTNIQDHVQLIEQVVDAVDSLLRGRSR